MDAPPFAGAYAPVRKKLGSGLLFVAGVLFPAFTIGFELVTRMCAEALFDPLPTLAHLAVVIAVPAINWRLWILRRRETPPHRGWIVAGAAAMAVGFGYALQFVPIYPIALIAILFAGLGLLPFAPMSAAIVAALLTGTLARQSGSACGKLVAIGATGGLLLVLALDVPAAITRVAVRGITSSHSADRARAIKLVRHFGDRDLLLRYCYEHSGRSGGLLGLLVDGGIALTLDDTFEDRNSGITPAAAQELYYRVTGESYNLAEPPFRGGPWKFVRNWEWDRDQGGAVVGQRVHGLSLRSSRIDGSMDADDAVAYVEWTTEFSNASRVAQEARMTLTLPPGGVVTRATLWVNGEEREAKFASRGAARAAYQAVVSARRDPLLVTTNGADQVFVQMFPVQSGGAAKLRVGITAPLHLSNDGRATLALPAIVDRNFSIDGALRHSVWIEGDGRLAAADKGFAAIPGNDVVRQRANFTDTELATRRPRIALSRNPLAISVASGEVIQSIRREPHEPAGPLFIVLDGSSSARDAGRALLVAARHIPPGVQVGFAIASVGEAQLPLAPWSPARAIELQDLIDREAFNGGEDNLGTVAFALGALEHEPAATLLWIHGPQGFDFTEHVAGLEQTLDRSTRVPRFLLLPIAPGPNKLLDHPRLFGAAHTLAWSGEPQADITAALDDYYDSSPRWTIRRTQGTPEGLVVASPHVAKLWARDEIDELMARNPAQTEAATLLAAKYQLVTPVSGAVVLETQAETDEVGLTPPDASAVPTIPEPSTWAMLIIACLALAWAAGEKRMRAT